MTALSPILPTDTSRQTVQIVAGRCLRRRLSSFDCSRCVDSCVAGVLTVAGTEVHIDNTKCTGCGRCTAVCPAEVFSFTGFDLHEVLDEIRTFENAVFTCHQTHRSFSNGFLLPCLGTLSSEALLSVGLKTTGEVYFNLTNCPNCDKHQAVQTLSTMLAGVQEALAEDSQVRFIAVTDRENLPNPETRNRRSFLLDMGDSVLAFIRHRYGNPAQDEKSPLPTTRRLPKKNALLQKTIATRAPAVSETLLSRCFPSLVFTASCTLCPRCTGMCPTGALRLERHPGSGKAQKLSFTAARCTGCGLCAAFCKAKAITISTASLVDDSVAAYP